VRLADAPDVLTVPELAELLRIGRHQAYALVGTGAIWSCRIGSSIRVPKIAVERFLDAQEGVSPNDGDKAEPHGRHRLNSRLTG
jgi:excisionase family DNA binding protein